MYTSTRGVCVCVCTSQGCRLVSVRLYAYYTTPVRETAANVLPGFDAKASSIYTFMVRGLDRRV